MCPLCSPSQSLTDNHYATSFNLDRVWWVIIRSILGVGFDEGLLTLISCAATSYCDSGLGATTAVYSMYTSAGVPQGIPVGHNDALERNSPSHLRIFIHLMGCASIRPLHRYTCSYRHMSCPCHVLGRLASDDWRHNAAHEMSVNRP